METKSTVIYRSLEEKITGREYKPGDRLPSESELCAEFNVSRGPVRAALDKLMAIGLIFKKKGGGSYVSEQDSAGYLDVLLPNLRFNTNDYREILDLQCALNRLSIESCLEHHDTNDYAGLDAIMDAIEDEHTVDEFFELDKSFHLAISEMSENRLLHNINALVWNLLQHCPKEGYVEDSIDVQLDELRNIYRSVKANDAELAVIHSTRRLKRMIRRDRTNQEPGQDVHRWNPWLYDTL